MQVIKIGQTKLFVIMQECIINLTVSHPFFTVSHPFFMRHPVLLVLLLPGLYTSWSWTPVCSRYLTTRRQTDTRRHFRRITSDITTSRCAFSTWWRNQLRRESSRYLRSHTGLFCQHASQLLWKRMTFIFQEISWKKYGMRKENPRSM